MLGLRFLKRTVNHEDRFAYHLYYGDEDGSTGSLVTFFPYPGADGRVGKPQPSAVAFVVPEGSLEYWLDRLADRGAERTERFDERVVSVRDPDGTPIELVAGDVPGAPWTETVSEEAAIRAIHGVTLLSANPYATAAILETLGFDLVAQEGDGFDIVRRATVQGSSISSTSRARSAPRDRERSTTSRYWSEARRSCSSGPTSSRSVITTSRG